jgi:hypothetical protein
MEKLKKPYLELDLDISPMFSYRDSRHAFGHRWQPEKPSHDWIWAVAGLVAGVVAILAFAARLA